MSLGFARDSVHDLANLGAASTTTAKSSLGVLPQEVGRTSVVALELDELLGKEDESLSSASRSTIESSAAPTKSDDRKSAASAAYGQYAGFTADYSEYEKYGGVTYADPYAQAAVLLGEQKKGGNGIFCCMFPWLASKPPPKIEDDQEEGNEQGESDDTLTNDGSVDLETAKSDDEVSTGSGAFGEKLTENERAAVLARLRLASPEIMAEPPIASTPAPKKGLLTDLEYESGAEETKDEETNGENGKKKLKPILRHSISKKPERGTLKNAASTDSTADGTNRRRSLFPQQYEAKPKNNKSVKFAPMARVVTVKSKNEMSELEKSKVWFQKRDYDDFKKTGRMIAKAMCEGGSEIWLATNDAWQNKAASRGASDGPRAIHSHDRKEIQESKGLTNGDKWWHKFGHSRRGLEHIASIEEGRQRQQNVRTAIRVVIDEQRRQKIYRKEDEEKLRMLALQYTTWARDLALAAAASDAEAVAVDFDENRKSREFYILKHARAQGGFSKQLPSFMMPVGRSPQVLDHHTSTQIRYRRKQARVAPSPTTTTVKDENSTGSEQPISDGSTTTRAKLAKKAAGFGTEDSDVSAILSGMGAVKKVAMPTPPQPTSVGAH